MYEGLKPCPHRQVDDSGRILCGWIKSGDRQVSVNLCRACPVPQINCGHLRASLQKNTPSPITVRYATGRVEVWNDEAPSIDFKQAACSVKTMPIHSARDCAGCPLRVPQVIPQSAVQVARQNRPATSPGQAHSQAAPSSAVPPAPVPASAAAVQVQPAAEASAADELVQRAQRMAARKERERRAAPPAPAPAAPPVEPVRAQRASPPPEPQTRAATAEHNGSTGETKSKIILLQQWLADQVSKKTRSAAPPAPVPDADSVSDIVYSPIAPSYQEEPGLERCVGWTD